jgi:hypothetical protein
MFDKASVPGPHEGDRVPGPGTPTAPRTQGYPAGRAGGPPVAGSGGPIQRTIEAAESCGNRCSRQIGTNEPDSRDLKTPDMCSRISTKRLSSFRLVTEAMVAGSLDALAALRPGQIPNEFGCLRSLPERRGTNRPNGDREGFAEEAVGRSA